MSKTVEIKSPAQLNSLISSSRIVVVNCKQQCPKCYTNFLLMFVCSLQRG
jgi:hypothetical protein